MQRWQASVRCALCALRAQAAAQSAAAVAGPGARESGGGHQEQNRKKHEHTARGACMANVSLIGRLCSQSATHALHRRAIAEEDREPTLQRRAPGVNVERAAHRLTRPRRHRLSARAERESTPRREGRISVTVLHAVRHEAAAPHTHRATPGPVRSPGGQSPAVGSRRR